MNLAKCELIKYRETHYLIFNDGRKPKIGDRVITPFESSLQTIEAFSNQYGEDGLCFTSNSGSAKLLASTLPLVAALVSEIDPNDLLLLINNKFGFIHEEDGVPVKKDGKITLTFNAANEDVNI